MLTEVQLYLGFYVGCRKITYLTDTILRTKELDKVKSDVQVILKTRATNAKLK